MELKIDSERVLEVSKKCAQTKEIMKGLFPQLFEKKIDLRKLKANGITFGGFENVKEATGKAGTCLVVPNEDCFILSTEFDWQLSDNRLYIKQRGGNDGAKN